MILWLVDLMSNNKTGNNNILDRDLAAVLEAEENNNCDNKEQEKDISRNKTSKRVYKKDKEYKEGSLLKEEAVPIYVSAEESDVIAAEENKKKFQKKIQTGHLWSTGNANIDKRFRAALDAAQEMRSIKIGIYASIPMYCKEDRCPYAESCLLLANGLTVKAQPCPREIALIQQKYTQYAAELGLDEEDCETRFVDEALLEEVLTMEVNMERCKALMSKEGSPIQMIVAGVSPNGEEYSQPAVSKAVEAYEKFSKKRNEAFNQLMATRKDKARVTKDTRELKTIQDVLDQIDSDPENDIFTIEQRPDNADELIEAGKIKKK